MVEAPVNGYKWEFKGRKEGMKGSKMGGKKFCCGKHYFERHVLQHIPETPEKLNSLSHQNVQ